MSTTPRKPRAKPTTRLYRAPSSIPAHEWANKKNLGPKNLNDTFFLNAKDNVVRIPQWRQAPFELTGAPGSELRKRQRVQAHKDRIMLLKKHHVIARKSMAHVAKQATAYEKGVKRSHATIAKLEKQARDGRTAKTRNSAADMLYEERRLLAYAKERHAKMKQYHAQHKKDVAKIEREINKLEAHQKRNVKKVPRRRATPA